MSTIVFNQVSCSSDNSRKDVQRFTGIYSIPDAAEAENNPNLIKDLNKWIASSRDLERRINREIKRYEELAVD